MTHWLDAVQRVLDQPDPGDRRRRALVLGDPLHRAADRCREAGMEVVRVATPHGVSVRRFDREPGDTVVWSDADSLPFEDGAFDLVVAHATLEFCSDDRQVTGELGRVLREGGQLVVRLPRRGRLTALDALNLYRYTAEITGRADVPVESMPIGWRRHYEESDLDAIFAPSPLSPTRVDRCGLGLGELAYFPGLVATRAVLDRPSAAQRLRGWYARFGDLDEYMPGPATFVVTATREGSHAETAPDDDPGRHFSNRDSLPV